MATDKDFAASLANVLRAEGGYVNNPADPGGATNKGITQKTFTAWLAKGGAVNRDVRTITDAEVTAIYREQYWFASGADKLPMPLALYHFDAAVNTGPAQAARFLTASGGDPTEYLAVRKAFYFKLAADRPELEPFLDGWLKRVQNLASSPAAVGATLAVIALLALGWLWYRQHQA